MKQAVVMSWVAKNQARPRPGMNHATTIFQPGARSVTAMQRHGSGP